MPKLVHTTQPTSWLQNITSSSTRPTLLSLKHPIISEPLLHIPIAMDLFQDSIYRLSTHPMILAINNIAPTWLVPTTMITTAIPSGPSLIAKDLLLNAIQALHAFKDRLVTNLHDILGIHTLSAPSANSLAITSANVSPKLAQTPRTNHTTKLASFAACSQRHHQKKPYTTPHVPTT